jgi:protein gp37
MSLQSDLQALADTEIDISKYFTRNIFSTCLFQDCNTCPVHKLIKKIEYMVIDKYPEEYRKSGGIDQILYKGKEKERQLKYGFRRCASVIDWNNEVCLSKKLKEILK